jgi:hypothetical protein
MLRCRGRRVRVRVSPGAAKAFGIADLEGRHRPGALQRSHGAAICGSAAVTLPAPEIAPPFLFGGKE